MYMGPKLLGIEGKICCPNRINDAGAKRDMNPKARAVAPNPLQTKSRFQIIIKLSIVNFYQIVDLKLSSNSSV